METEQTDKPPFLEAIDAAVKEHWGHRRSGLLLSRIGQLLTQNGYNLQEELQGRKLGDVLVTDLAEKIEVVRDEKFPTLLRAVPKGAAEGTPGQLDILGAQGETTAPRLARTLWFAFSKPIPAGHERRLQLEPGLRFWDQLPPLNEVAGRLPIEARYVVPHDQNMPREARDERIMGNIRAWMREMQLDIEKFEQKTLSRKTHAAAGSGPLLALIGALGEEDMRRISIPLDIVAKLLKK